MATDTTVPTDTTPTVTIGSLHGLSVVELERAATTNLLTGLPNRYLFEHFVDQVLVDDDARAARLSVVFVDLNAFRSINDALGHEFGNLVLKAVARRLTSAVGGYGMVAHFAADEFAILLTDPALRANIESFAAMLCDEIASPLRVGGKEIFTSCTIGICHYPEDASNRIELMQNADTVMHYAKQYHVGGYAFYSRPLGEQAHRRLDIERNLRRAIERDELTVLYQPKVNLKNRRVIGAEALLRWTSAEIGFVPPDEFIGIAEQTGQIVDIGHWVLETVCEQAGEWQGAGYADIHIGVNLSAVQFLHGDLVRSLRQVLGRTGVEPHRLDLELTETMLVSNPERTITMLHELKDIGVAISMDDFGTGYSSLSMLTRFPLDSLKVDRAFVINLPGDHDAAMVARTIVAMAQQLSLNVVAEGIETESQMTFLNALGCDIGQGYLYGKPMAADDFAKLICGPRR